jgi:hypothetical protein
VQTLVHVEEVSGVATAKKKVTPKAPGEKAGTSKKRAATRVNKQVKQVASARMQTLQKQQVQ